MDTLRERFFSKVEKTGYCWVWLGQTNGKYGKLRGNGGKNSKFLFAHRVSYELHYREIPTGKIIMHKCDNPICVNPEHLKIGTHKENTHDMYLKNRNVRPTPNPVFGDRHWASKLSDSQITQIRKEYSGAHGQKKYLANKYQISESSMGKILNNKTRVVNNAY